MDVGCCYNSWHVPAGDKIFIILITTSLVRSEGCIKPDMQLLIPTYGEEAGSLDFNFRSIVDADECSDLCVNLGLTICAQELLKLLTIGEVPNLYRSIGR